MVFKYATKGKKEPIAKKTSAEEADKAILADLKPVVQQRPPVQNELLDNGPPEDILKS
jgi:hypothetical protein